MKTSSTTSTRREPRYAKATIDRAMQYATQAIYSSELLRNHYTAIAKVKKLRNALEAAFQDYLRHERKFRELNRAL
jgi:hypothetical protein